MRIPFSGCLVVCFVLFFSFFSFHQSLFSSAIFKTTILNNVYFAFEVFLFNSNYNQFLQSYSISFVTKTLS